MLPPRYGNIPIQNNDDRLDAEVEHANRPIHGRDPQPQFGADARGGQFEYDRGDGRDTSAALSRGTLNHTLDMRGGTAYVGGHSRETESNMAYERDAGYTMPRGTRREEAGNQAAIDAGNAIREREAVEGPMRPPQQPEQGRGQQQEQRPQAQQREQAQAQPAQQAMQERGQKKEKKANIHDTPQNLARQDMFAARLRGRIDAFDDAGLVKVEARKGFDSVENFNTAKGTFYATKDAISSRKFAAMAESAAPAAGNQPQQEQPEQSTEMSSPKGRFATMADRAIEGTKPTTEAGTVIKKDTGMEQG